MIRLSNLILMCIFTLFLGTACTQQATPVYTILQGKLPSGVKEAKISYGDERQTLTLAEDGTFIDTLSVTIPHYVDISFGENYFWIYLAPGDEVSISADADISFSGSNAAINTYLYEEAMAGRSASMHQIYLQEEADFVRYQDSIRANKMVQLEQLPAGSEAFQNFHQKGIDYEYLLNVAQYPMYHSYYFEAYKPTETITGVYQNLALDNEEDAQQYATYRSLVSYILNQQSENLVDTNFSLLKAKLAVLEDIQSPTILHEQLSEALHYFSANEVNIEKARDQMLALAKLDKTKAAITKHYDVIRQLQPGMPSPNFEYENYVGGNTKLADLKGKYVYIDLWATWCSPCIREIPHLKKLEEEFHKANIEFVSISIDELKSRDKWRNMIEKRELSGTQLLADKDWNSDFVRSYGVRGIPYFILLDDQGNIVSANAERPSNPQLKDRLQALGL